MPRTREESHRHNLARFGDEGDGEGEWRRPLSRTFVPSGIEDSCTRQLRHFVDVVGDSAPIVSAAVAAQARALIEAAQFAATAPCDPVEPRGATMLRHVAVFVVTPEFAADGLDEWMDCIRDLARVVLEVRSMSIGRTMIEGANAWEVAIAVDFEIR